MTRTNDRKGYRDPRPYVNTSPYQSSPKTRIRIELEVDDDITVGMSQIVDMAIEMECQALSDKNKCRLAAAEKELRDAQDHFAVVKKEVEGGV